MKKDLLTLITHSGIFHADDVFTVAALKSLYPNIEITRLNNIPEIICDDTIVVDVGLGEYDHHQPGGNGARANGVPYASFGLIWRDFGERIVNKLFPTCNFITDVVKDFDQLLVQGIDAIDNGIMPRVDYTCQPLTINQIISLFNPSWDSNLDSDTAFNDAVSIASRIFTEIIHSIISKYNAKSIVEDAIKNSTNKVIILEQFVPWQEHLLSSTLAKANEIEFIIFPSLRGGYNIQVVPNTFPRGESRKNFPSTWFENLPVGITFLHPAGFLASVETLALAIAFAEEAVNS